MWTWLITGLILCIGGQSESQVVHENYGVIFTEEGILEPVHDVWHHTFAINISTPTFPDYEIPCQNAAVETVGTTKRSVHTWQHIRAGTRCSLEGTCNDTVLLDRLCPTIRENKKRHDFLRRSVLDLYYELDKLIPEADVSRMKRGLFDAVGMVYKSLFGIATVHDTRVLKRHIRRVRDKTNQINNQINIFGTEFESYIAMQNNHDELIQEALENNNKYINLTILQIMKQAVQTELVVADAVNYVHLMNLHYTAVLVDIRSDLKTKLNGIHNLMRGFLPPELVPVDTLSEALHAIKHELTNYTHIYLTHGNHLFYYHIQDVTYTRDNDMLYIKIKIPLTSSADIFQLYRLHTVPIILGHNRSEYTQIDILDKYLAISSNGKFYTTLSESEYSLCSGSQYMRCDSLMRMKQIDDSSCMFGLFRGNSTVVAQNCKTNLVMNPDDTVLTLRPGKYFISSRDTTWSMICRGKEPRAIQACHHCRISVPCNCALHGSQIYIPEIFMGCDPSDTPTMVHSTNIPALLEFYKQSKDALNISSRKSFSKPLAVPFPEINIISHEFDDVVQKLDSSKISLKAIEKNTKKDRQMFLTPTAKLREDIGLAAKQHFDYGVLILSSASAAIATLALCLSLRNAKLILLARSARAYDFLATATTPANSGESSSDWSWPYLFQTLIFLCTMVLVFGILVGVIIFVKRLHRYYNSQNVFPLPIHTTLHVVFYGKGKYVTKKLGTYPGSVANLQIIQTKACQMSRMTRCLMCLRYGIKIDWTFLDITHKPANDKITLPTDLHFPMLNGRKTRDILEDPDVMVLVGEYSHTYYEMFAWYKGTENQVNPDLNMTMTPHHIYPVIPYAPPSEERADVPV